MNFNDLFTARLIAANYLEAQGASEPYLGEAFFPRVKKAGLDLAFIKANGGLPVSLMPSAFDAQATYRDRVPVEVLRTEMPFFREGMKIKERDRQELLRVRDLDDPYANEVFGRIFDDSRNLIDGANVVPERMRMQLLFPVNGNLGITINANGVAYVYNYDPDGTWKANNYFVLSGTSLWSATATADPFTDIQTAKRAIRRQTGAEGVYALMSANTFNALAKTNAVLSRVRNMSNAAVSFVSDGEIRGAFRDAVDVELVVYDRMYKNEAGDDRFFVPDGYVTIVPEGALGSTYFGTTPEEADLQGEAGVDVEIVDTGIAITVEKKHHPVQVNTFASEIVLPSFERADSVATIKVL